MVIVLARRQSIHKGIDLPHLLGPVRRQPFLNPKFPHLLIVGLERGFNINPTPQKPRNAPLQPIHLQKLA